MTTYRLDGSYRRFDRVVIGGSPLRLFRVSAAGVGVLQTLESGSAPPAGHDPLTDRLVDAGAIHPQPVAGPYTAADVTIVIPAFGVVPSTIVHGEVIVVDDCSVPPLLAADGQRMIRLDRNRGAGAARNRGLADVTTPLVAFVDTDVDVDAGVGVDGGWLAALLPHFADPKVALVAPRVASAPGPSWLAAYEVARSPLDLGDEPARVSAGTRVSYVPAAALVMRVDALRAVGGFDEALRTGEDVDLVWRLADAGYRCRYEPDAVVDHRPRSTLTAMLGQRFGYGRSASALDGKHPGAVAPLRMSGWSAAVWALLLARRPVSAAAVAVGTTVALQRKVPDVPAAECGRLAGLGHLYAGRQVAGTITRVWWPLALLLGVFLRRSRIPLLGAALVAPLLEWRQRRGPLDPLRYTAIRLADDIAYGSGVWVGAIQRRRLGALLPRFTSWPGRSGG